MSNEVDDGQIKKIVAYWPIILTALAVTVSAASANTRLDNVNERVQYIWDNGSPSVAVRLARIEEKQDHIDLQLDRIENKLDNRYIVSPETRKKLKDLQE